MKTLLLALALTAFTGTVHAQEINSSEAELQTEVQAEGEFDFELSEDLQFNSEEALLRHPHPPARYVRCMARAGRYGQGRAYFGDGFTRRQAENEAVRRCYNHGHRHCEVRSCSVYRR